MYQCNNDSELNNLICEADGCIAKATIEIKVKAGPQKVILLSLCDNCVSEFQEAT